MDLDEKISKMKQIKNKIEFLTADLQKELSILEAEVKEEVLSNGTSYENEYAKVQIRNPKPKTTWDSEKLLGYAVTHEEILKFCTTTQPLPNVAITWRK
jgi:hypothetical protein